MSGPDNGQRRCGGFIARDTSVYVCRKCNKDYSVKRSRDRCPCHHNPFDLNLSASSPERQASTPSAGSVGRAAGSSLFDVVGPGNHPTANAGEGFDGDGVADSGNDIGGGVDGADDEQAPSSDSGAEDEDTSGPGGLGGLRQRIEENFRLSELGADHLDECNVDDGGGLESFVEPDAIGLDDEEYDDFQGICPDASSGEGAHQLNNSGVSVDCGRNPPQHMGRRANPSSAMLALSNGLKYDVTRYNRKSQQHEIVTVQPGDGCVRIMQSLAHCLGHDRVPTDIHAKATQTPAQLRGQFPGSAVWPAYLFKTGDQQQEDGAWQARAASSKYRPDEGTLLGAYNKFFGCGMQGGCSNSRCPDCWDDGGRLQTVSIDCSRYLRVPMSASCGLGRLKGGDVKSATRPGPRDDWALGSGGGDSVEVHEDPSTMSEAGRVDSKDLNLFKVLYFFRHEGNRPLLGRHPPPVTWFVLGYDYTGVRHANDRLPDSVTGHPILQLRARGRPAVYPAAAVHRQVHLYHACSLGGDGDGADASHVCGVVPGTGSSASIWRHNFRQASPEINGYDRYLLNEVHHSINQDTFV